MIKKIIKKYWILLFFVLLINIPIFLLGIIRTNKEITSIGDLTNINSYLEIENAKEQKGSFSSIYVTTFEKSTILQNILLSLDNKIDIEEIPSSSIHLTDWETYLAGQIQKQSSIDSSIIYAYKKSNTDINYSYLGLKVSYYNLNSGFLIGDLLYKINDIDASIGRNEFRAYLKECLHDDKLVYFEIKRNDEIIKLKENRNFNAYDYYQIDYDNLSPKIIISKTNTGGPSAGFMQALCIYNQINDFDYTRGLKICGTGTIDINGNVGEIGGIKQKIYTADLKGADMFFCPEANFDEAKEAYDKLNTKMKLIKISKFEEAINYLYEL